MKNSRIWKKHIAALAALSLGFLQGAPALLAEGDIIYGNWNMGFDISFPQQTGGTRDVLKNGFGFDWHTGYQKPDNILGLRIDVSHASFNITDKVLSHIDGADDGYATVWGLGTSVSLASRNSKKLKPSLFAGPGVYYERAEATRYGVTGGYICDPWFGCYPAVGPGEIGIAKISTTRFGWQGGAGVDYVFDGGGAITLSVQYIHIYNTNVDTEYIPLNLGFTQRF